MREKKESNYIAVFPVFELYLHVWFIVLSNDKELCSQVPIFMLYNYVLRV